MSEFENWIAFSDPNLPLTLKYPGETPQGYPVHINYEARKTRYRAHLVSQGSQGVYFEVGRYRDIAVGEAIQAFLKEGRERNASLEASPVEHLTFRDFPAHRFSIRLPDRVRMILFIEGEGALYRIIYDPSSPVNQKMLDSLVFLER